MKAISIPVSIVIAAGIIGAAIYLSALQTNMDSARYDLWPAGNGVAVYRADRQTGAVWLCIPQRGCQTVSEPISPVD